MNIDPMHVTEGIRQRNAPHIYRPLSRRYMRKLMRMRLEREAHKRFWRSKLGDDSMDGRMDRYYASKEADIPDHI